MPHRLSVILELDTPEDLAPGASRSEQIEAMRREATAVKQKVLARIEKLRWRDPDLEVHYLPSISPTMIVRSTEEVLRELAQAPEVLSMSPECQAELHR